MGCPQQTYHEHNPWIVAQEKSYLYMNSDKYAGKYTCQGLGVGTAVVQQDLNMKYKLAGQRPGRHHTDKKTVRAKIYLSEIIWMTHRL